MRLAEVRDESGGKEKTAGVCLTEGEVPVEGLGRMLRGYLLRGAADR